jgi:hypothetical protein
MFRMSSLLVVVVSTIKYAIYTFNRGGKRWHPQALVHGKFSSIQEGFTVNLNEHARAWRHTGTAHPLVWLRNAVWNDNLTRFRRDIPYFEHFSK